MTGKKDLRLLNLAIGPILFLICCFGLRGIFDNQASAAVGVTLWMMYWWVTGPVGLSVTAFLPVAINAFYPIIPMGNIFAQYSSGTIVLLLGANLLTIPWTSTGLDKRLALGSLRIVGTSVKGQMVTWFLLSAVISAFLPNTVVVTLFAPVAVAMLVFLGHKDMEKSDLAAPILLAVCYGSIIGGGITPLGGAMNVIAMNLISTHTGTEFMFIDWVLHMTPYCILVGAVLIAAMLLAPVKTKKIEGTRDYFKSEYAKLGKITKGQVTALVMFVLGVLLCTFRPLFAKALPGLDTSCILFTLGLLTFIVPGDDKKPLSTWKDAEKNIMWTMLFIIAGASVMGAMLTETTAAKTIAELISGMSLTGGIGTILIFVLLAYIIAECSSQTGAAAISIPVVLSVTLAVGLNPVPYLFITCMAFTGSYMMPNGVRAIPMGHGVPTGIILKRGSYLFIANIIAVVVIGLLLMNVWPYFGQLAGF